MKKGMKRLPFFALLALALVSISPPDALAADPVETEDHEAEPRPHPATFALFLGGLRADDNSGQLLRDGDAYGWGLSGGYFVHRYLSLEGEFLWFRRDYERVSDTVIPGTADNKQRYLTIGLSALAKASRRFNRWRPFVGVGAGYYSTEPYVTQPVSGLFGTRGAPSSASSVGYQITVGVTAKVRKHFHLEAGWKAILLSEEFGIYSNGEVNLGGNMIYLAARGGGL
jgi:opacity protein-like surface antigen